MKKLSMLFSALLLSGIVWAPVVWGHDGVTPTQVITDMKHKQKGPYAAPLLRGRSLSQDWLGITAEDYRMDDVSGVLIQKVKEDGIGDSEGLEQADIIVGAKVEEKETAIGSLSDLDDFLAAIKEPLEVDFIVIRQGDKTTEGVYLVPSLEEVAPEMAGVMGGTDKPQPGMMIDKMMAQSPLGGMQLEGKQLRPGMFMEDMMARSPLGRRNGYQRDEKPGDPLEEFVAKKLQENTLYKQYQKELEISDGQLQDLHELQMEYKKQRIKADADLKIKQIELEEALRGQADIDKVEEALEELDKVHKKQHEQTIKFLKELISIIKPEQRAKFRELLGN